MIVIVINIDLEPLKIMIINVFYSMICPVCKLEVISVCWKSGLNVFSQPTVGERATGEKLHMHGGFDFLLKWDDGSPSEAVTF